MVCHENCDGGGGGDDTFINLEVSSEKANYYRDHFGARIHDGYKGQPQNNFQLRRWGNY